MQELQKPFLPGKSPPKRRARDALFERNEVDRRNLCALAAKLVFQGHNPQP